MNKEEEHEGEFAKSKVFFSKKSKVIISKLAKYDLPWNDNPIKPFCNAC